MIILLIMLAVASVAGSIFVFIRRNQAKAKGLEYKKIQAIGLGLLALAIVMAFSAFYISQDAISPSNNVEIADNANVAASYIDTSNIATSVESEDIFLNTVPVELSQYCSIGIPSAWDNPNHREDSNGGIILYPNSVSNSDVKIELRAIKYTSPISPLIKLFADEENKLRTKVNIGGGLSKASICTDSSKNVIWEELVYDWKDSKHNYTSMVVFFPQTPYDALEYTLEMANKSEVSQRFDDYYKMFQSIIGTSDFQYSYTEKDILECLAADEKRKNSGADNSVAASEEASIIVDADTANSSQKELVTSDGSNDASSNEINTYKDDIRGHIIVNYSGTTVDSITLNEDYGTDKEGDYIALINLTWTVKNKGEMSKKVLKMYSDDLAATVASECPNIQEIAIFWTVPYLNADAKCSYERKGESMYEMDMVWDTVFDK